MERDKEHLKLLSIFHYIVGALSALWAMFPIIHLILGLVFILAPEACDKPPAFIGWFFVIFSSMFIMTGWVFAGLVIIAGRFIGHHIHRTFCLVVACMECIFMPFGTVLGVFTIIVLMRESVKELFAANESVGESV